MSVNDPVVPPLEPLSETDRLTALMNMTGDLALADSLQKTLPLWLTDATPAQIAAFESAMRELQASQLKVKPALERLRPLDEFCRAELTEALTKKYGVSFNVTEDRVELPGFDCGCLDSTSVEDAGKKKIIARRSLLKAAMHNFTEDETAPRLNEQRARELWLPQEWVSPARSATWIAFNDEPASDGLFRLLAELGDAADCAMRR